MVVEKSEVTSKTGIRIVFDDTVREHNEYEEEVETRITVDVPYKDKRHVKELDWDECHQDWDPELERWLIDGDSIRYAKRALERSGFDVVITQEVEDDHSIVTPD